MDPRLRYRRGKRSLWLAGRILTLVFLVVLVLVLIRVGYAHQWTGFGQFKGKAGIHPKTLWDWMDLLVVPIVLAVGGYLFTRSENRRTQAAAGRRAQDEALQAYLDQLGMLLLERGLRGSERGAEVRKLARARTLTALKSLDAEHNRSLLTFLAESELIAARDVAIISFVQADLRRTDLGGAYLGGTQLGNADLSEANLRGADLSKANLIEANLRGADLRGNILEGANLSGNNMRKAYLDWCYLRKANLSEANLSKAHIVGAVMPNGQKYEDWVKDREGRRDDGENGEPWYGDPW